MGHESFFLFLFQKQIETYIKSLGKFKSTHPNTVLTISAVFVLFVFKYLISQQIQFQTGSGGIYLIRWSFSWACLFFFFFFFFFHLLRWATDMLLFCSVIVCFCFSPPPPPPPPTFLFRAPSPPLSRLFFFFHFFSDPPPPPPPPTQ